LATHSARRSKVSLQPTGAPCGIGRSSECGAKWVGAIFNLHVKYDNAFHLSSTFSFWYWQVDGKRILGACRRDANCTLLFWLLSKAETHCCKVVCMAAVRALDAALPSIGRPYRSAFGNSLVRLYHSLPPIAVQIPWVSEIKFNTLLSVEVLRPKEGQKFMRFLSRVFVVAVGLLAIGLVSSLVLAKTLLVGTFTLSHPTQLKNAMLPAGDYTFKLAGTQTDTNLLTVRGAKKTVDIMIFAQSACETCRSGALKVAVQGDNRAVTSLDLPGFHVDFKVRQSTAEREESSKVPASMEQVAVHVNAN
jgi:hypothetical protein